MKTRIIITALFIGLCILVNAQTWQWANSGGGPSGDYGRKLCSDNAGNVYIAGSIMSNPVYFHTDTLATNGFDDHFIAKYDINGNELWVKRFGGPNTYQSSETASGICFDTIANCLYLVSSFVTSCSFDTITLTTGVGNRQILIAKFDNNGHCLWAKSAGGIGNDNAGSPIITEGGSLIFGGNLQYWGDFDTISIPAGGFMAKYNSSGNCVWAKKMFTGCSGAFAQYGSDFFAHGIYSDSIVIIDTLIFNTSSSMGKFLARFDSIGNIKWARFFGGPLNESGGELVIDDFGNCYFPGIFSGSFAAFGNDTIYSDNTYTYYIAKYDQQGNKKWVQTVTGAAGYSSPSVYGEGITIDQFSRILITGGFIDTAYFGSTMEIATSGGDMFVARYDSNGSFMNVVHQCYGQGNDIVCDINNAVIIAGEFINSIDFGSTSLKSNGSYDAFVAKLTSFTLDIKKANRTINDLLIYANPNTGKCTIEVPEDFVFEDKLVLSIYNFNGLLIQQQTLIMDQEKVLLNLEAEAKGVYTAILSNGKKTYIGKIIFE